MILPSSSPSFSECSRSRVKATKCIDRILPHQILIEALEQAGDEASYYLRQHHRGMWGDLSEEDAQANEFALEHGLWILSAHKLSDGTRIWILTESDRSATTILLPAEY